jgi:hypothetical protein
MAVFVEQSVVREKHMAKFKKTAEQAVGRAKAAGAQAGSQGGQLANNWPRRLLNRPGRPSRECEGTQLRR